MRIGEQAARLVADERGGVLVLVAVCLPVLAIFLAFVVDVGNWFLHKRHLQLQADAGALAGGGLFTHPCSDSQILEGTRKYAGDPSALAPYNLQVPPTDPGNIHVLVNSTTYWNKGGTDFSDGGQPCSTKFVDVKITEADLPLFFDVVPGFDGVLPAINAHARVQVQALTRASGMLPVGVPDVNPRAARAIFVDETKCTSTGCAVIASTPLERTGSVDGLAIWDNVAAPVSVPISASRIGVRVALGGSSSTTCGDPLVECYDLESQNGIVFIRGWSSSGSGAQPNAPLARSVTLFPGSCSDPYFSSASSSCSIGVRATVDFGVSDPTTVGAKVSAVVAGAEKALTYDAAASEWVSTSANYFSVGTGAGPLPVELKWEETTGTQGGNTCKEGGGNKCKGTFGTVQRSFSASAPRSGPIKLAQVSEGPFFWTNSFELGTTHDLVVKIGLAGKLQNATGVDDPLVSLRVSGSGSLNQSIDCDPKLANLRDEIVYGCAPTYAINAGSPCPSTATSLWSTAQPWNCVAVQTGGAVGQVTQGMNERVHKSSTTCTSPSNWASFPNIPADDPRIVPVILTPFGSFNGSGNSPVPVTDFATIYVTGWDGNPCADDDPVPDKGYIVGHFIKHIYDLNTGGGSGEACDLDGFGSCVAVMTE